MLTQHYDICWLREPWISKPKWTQWVKITHNFDTKSAAACENTPQTEEALPASTFESYSYKVTLLCWCGTFECVTISTHHLASASWWHDEMKQKQGSASHKQEAHPTPSIMQQSYSPDAAATHRNLLQVRGGGRVWRCLYNSLWILLFRSSTWACS